MTNQTINSEDTILLIVKSRLSIHSDVRDQYLKSIIQGLIEELQEINGLTLNIDKISHQLFIADYAEYRYSNREQPNMPRHLRWRLNNMIIKKVGGSDDG